MRTALILIGALFTVPAAANAKHLNGMRVAIAPIDRSGPLEQSAARALTSHIEALLKKSPDYQPVALSQASSAHNRVCMQQPGCVRRVCRRLQASYLIAGHVAHFDGQFHLDLRVVSGRTGAVLASGSRQASKADVLARRGALLAHRLAQQAAQGIHVAAAADRASDAVVVTPHTTRRHADQRTHIATRPSDDTENPLEQPAAEEKTKARSTVSLASDGLEVEQPLAATTVAKAPGHDDGGSLWSGRFWPAWTAAGVGLAALGTGIGFGVACAQQNDAAHSATYQGEAYVARDAARKDALVANVMYGVGGAALVTSGVLMLLEYRAAKREARENLSPLPIGVDVAHNGGLVQVSGGF